MNLEMKKPASSLLLAIALTSLLLSLTLAVSTLVIWDLRAARVEVAGFKARYAAEGMSELGLLDIKKGLPGYQPSYEDFEFTSNATASLTSFAKNEVVPCDGTFRRISMNESVQFPLFTQEELEGPQSKVLDFVVDFYVGDEDGVPVFNPTRGAILRWKVIGFRDEAGFEQTTEAVSEFISLWDASHNSPENPSQFGSSVGRALADAYTRASYYDTVRHQNFPSYSIRDFLNGHRVNNLVLTSFLPGDGQFLYVKLHAIDAPAACEINTLKATGLFESEDLVQSLQTQVREGENLPVFDFVLGNVEDKSQAP